MNIKKRFTIIAQIIDMIINMIYIFLWVFVIFIFIGFLYDRTKGLKDTIFGHRPIVIITESMEPAIIPKSVILGKSVSEVNDLKKDDIVTFWIIEENTKKFITHRIIDIDYNTGYLQTKGDNNNSLDRFDDENGLPFVNVIYRIDYIFNFLSPLSTLVIYNRRQLVALGAIFIGMGLLWHFIKKELYDKQYEFKINRRKNS